MPMRHHDKVTATSSRPVTPGGQRYCRHYGITGLVLIATLPVVIWSSNNSTGEDLSGPTQAVTQTGISGNQGNKRSATTPSSPPGEENSPAEADSSQTFSDTYDLALGKSVFNHTCLTCHGNSVHDAPRVGDMNAWQPRLAQGLDVLIEHALDGHGRMPAKGGYSSLTDYEVGSAVAYVYQVGSEILANHNNPITHAGCDPVSNLDQCTPEELKKLLILQMLWLLGGPRQ